VWAVGARAEGWGMRAVARGVAVASQTVLVGLGEVAEPAAFSSSFLHDRGVTQGQRDDLLARLRAVKAGEVSDTTWKVIALKEANGENPQQRVSKEVNPREDQDYAADRRGARHDPSRTGPVS
jgi:hypothetical protein